MKAPATYRYSPVNHLIVDWGFNGHAFPDCSLPEPQCPAEPVLETANCCKRIPVQEAIDTYDWERWLPEVIVGIDTPDEEIAANYVREAAIEFCKTGRVLQREVVVELQPGITTYPLFPYEGEQIIGVIGFRKDGGCAHACSGCHGSHEGLNWRMDVARNEIHFECVRECAVLRLLVWAAPTEDACAHDKFLYERFRRDITLGARLLYANAVHFRDRALMASLPTMDSFLRAALIAKNKVMMGPSSWQQQAGSGLFGPQRPQRFHRNGL